MGKGAKTCVYAANCCVYTALTDELVMGCSGSETMLCIDYNFCLAAGKTAFPIGLIKEEGAILKCGLPCCTYGLVKPTVCVSGGGECLCVKGAAAFPFKEGLVPSLMCTICFFSIIGPNTGCMAEPPAFDAPGGKPVADMER